MTLGLLRHCEGGKQTQWCINPKSPSPTTEAIDFLYLYNIQMPSICFVIAKEVKENYALLEIYPTEQSVLLSSTDSKGIVFGLEFTIKACLR